MSRYHGYLEGYTHKEAGIEDILKNVKDTSSEYADSASTYLKDLFGKKEEPKIDVAKAGVGVLGIAALVAMAPLYKMFKHSNRMGIYTTLMKWKRSPTGWKKTLAGLLTPKDAAGRVVDSYISLAQAARGNRLGRHVIGRGYKAPMFASGSGPDRMAKLRHNRTFSRDNPLASLKLWMDEAAVGKKPAGKKLYEQLAGVREGLGEGATKKQGFKSMRQLLKDLSFQPSYNRMILEKADAIKGMSTAGAGALAAPAAATAAAAYGAPELSNILKGKENE